MKQIILKYQANNRNLILDFGSYDMTRLRNITMNIGQTINTKLLNFLNDYGSFEDLNLEPITDYLDNVPIEVMTDFVDCLATIKFSLNEKWSGEIAFADAIDRFFKQPNLEFLEYYTHGKPWGRFKKIRQKAIDNDVPMNLDELKTVIYGVKYEKRDV